MWKDKEEYIFDMPGPRIDDVYGKNARLPLRAFMKQKNPKVTGMRFHETAPGVIFEIGHPKYPESYPYFTQEDQANLLASYMEYANMTYEELSAWYKVEFNKHAKSEQE